MIGRDSTLWMRPWERLSSKGHQVNTHALLHTHRQWLSTCARVHRLYYKLVGSYKWQFSYYRAGLIIIPLIDVWPTSVREMTYHLGFRLRKLWDPLSVINVTSSYCKLVYISCSRILCIIKKKKKKWILDYFSRIPWQVNGSLIDTIIVTLIRIVLNDFFYTTTKKAIFFIAKFRY